MFFEYACHLLVREGVDWLILAVVLAWRMISLQLRDSAIGHQTSCCYFDCIVQIKMAVVKGTARGVRMLYKT
jgi:hypothetical protein